MKLTFLKKVFKYLFIYNIFLAHHQTHIFDTTLAIKKPIGPK